MIHGDRDGSSIGYYSVFLIGVNFQMKWTDAMEDIPGDDLAVARFCDKSHIHFETAPRPVNPSSPYVPSIYQMVGG
jgi:hypothetical protein